MLSELTSILEKVMGDAYPVLIKDSEIIKANLVQEEQQFTSTLDQGMQVLESAVENLEGNTITGDIVFKLYDTFGFPVDMTADFARERSLGLDLDGYESLMQEQRDRARSASNFDSMIPESLNIQGHTEFVGYDSNAISSNVIELSLIHI